VIPWLLLTAAILLEVIGTIALKFADGFTNLVPSAIVLVCYVTSFVLLSIVLRDLSLSLTYAVWAGAGTALVAAVGILALNEPATALKIGSIVLIIIGVMGLNYAGE